MCAQEKVRLFVLFGYNSYGLTPEAHNTIDGMLKETGNNRVTKIESYGHTDSDGQPEANRILSQNRVNAVQEYLITKVYDLKLFVTGSSGEHRPALSDATGGVNA